MEFHSIDSTEVLEALASNVERGLSAQQVSERRAQHGPNRLKERKGKSNLQRFFDQFKDVMILILIAAAAVSFVIACIEGNPMEFFEPALILLIVVLNAVMGMMQESKAEKALDALKSMSAPHARVLRDGGESVVDAAELVPGDIIRLEAGDFIPADARLLRSTSLKSEESALTGESVPSEKDARAQVAEKASLGDRTNMVFSGCSVTYGTATAVVTSTGMATEMGKIAGLLEGGQTLAFMVLALSQVVQAFNMRSEHSLFAIGFFTNGKLNLACLTSVLLVALVLFTPVRVAFGLLTLTPALYLLGLGLALVPLVAMELSKALGLIRH